MLFLTILIFANNFCEIDGVRYPKDNVIVDCETNNYLDQHRDLKTIL